MIAITLQESTKELLDDPLLEGSGLDEKIRTLLRTEYLRRLGRYKRIDVLLSQKYRVTFAGFHDQDVVVQKGFSWEVEKDAIEWETAVSGMRTMEQKLNLLRDTPDVSL